MISHQTISGKIMEKTEVTLRYGLITEVLKDKGRAVQSYEDLFPSANEPLHLVPSVVGVFQRPWIPNEIDPIFREQAKASIEEMVQNLCMERFGKRDQIPSGLISLVYNPSLWNPELLSFYLQGDVFRRLKLIGYDAVPQYSQKEEKETTNLNNFCQRLDIENEEHVRKLKAHIETESEYYEALKQDYGLTLREAVNYETLQKTLTKLKAREAGIIYPEGEHGKLPLSDMMNMVSDMIGQVLSRILRKPEE